MLLNAELFTEYELEQEILNNLNKYKELIYQWNSSINLVSPKELESNFDLRHIKDSCQLSAYLNKNHNIIDVGSGGGLPGIIVSILLQKPITMVESNSKKTSFLNIVNSSLNLKNIILNERIERVSGKYDCITARAFASLEKILLITESISHTQTEYILLKGQSVQDEIEKASEIFKFDYGKYPSTTSQSSFIIRVYNVVRI